MNITVLFKIAPVLTGDAGKYQDLKEALPRIITEAAEKEADEEKGISVWHVDEPTFYGSIQRADLEIIILGRRLEQDVVEAIAQACRKILPSGSKIRVMAGVMYMSFAEAVAT